MVVLEQLRLAIRKDSTGLRPHERESMLTRDNGSEIRVLVMLSFPIMVALVWLHVADGTEPMFAAGVASILLLNALGWLVPWRRLPRWCESVPPLGSIVALWCMVAPAGGMDSGFALMFFVPLIWVAMYADTPDLVIGLAIAGALVLPPTHDWIDALPFQGDLAQRGALLILLVTVTVGLRPLVNALRDQVRTSRRATYSLRASQAALAHDLRTPLTSMCALAELADQRLDASPAEVELAREYVGRIAALGWRAETTIRGVLDLSRAAELLHDVTEVDVRELLDEVVAGVEGAHVEVGDVPERIVGHLPSIRQLFTNLFENAASHGVSPTPGDVARVEVTGSQQVGGWQFTVRDHGPGIPAAEADVVFEPWRRGTNARDGGHGLGLAIVAAIVEQHGGTIEVRAAEPSGASFVFTLSRTPRVATHDEETVARAATGVPVS